MAHHDGPAGQRRREGAEKRRRRATASTVANLPSAISFSPALRTTSCPKMPNAFAGGTGADCR